MNETVGVKKESERVSMREREREREREGVKECE